MLKNLIRNFNPSPLIAAWVNEFKSDLRVLANGDISYLRVNLHCTFNIFTGLWNLLMLLTLPYVYDEVLNSSTQILALQFIVIVITVIDLFNEPVKNKNTDCTFTSGFVMVLVKYLGLLLLLNLTTYISRNPNLLLPIDIFMRGIDSFSYKLFVLFEKTFSLDDNYGWDRHPLRNLIWLFLKEGLSSFSLATQEAFAMIHIWAALIKQDGILTSLYPLDLIYIIITLNIYTLKEDTLNIVLEVYFLYLVLYHEMVYIIQDWMLYIFNKSAYNYYSHYDTTNYSPLVQECISEANQRKVIHIMPLNLNVNRYTGVNTHFPSYKQSTLLNLTVWQYWWWMSFIAVMVLFNRLLLKIFLSNTLRIEPKVHTSMKSNGRWGDLVASLFPVFWCSNILVNSNFILRIIENHSESGVFVVRIRGKQWYWVYKFSVNLKNDLNDMSIIIGRGNKLNVTYGVHNNIPSNHVIPSTRWTQKINNSILVNKYLNSRTLKLTAYTTKIPSSLNMFEVPDLINTRRGLIKWDSVNLTDQLVTKKPVKHDKYYLSTAKRKLLLTKTYKCHGNKLFVLRHQTNHSYRPYNRFFYSIQQQPKSIWKGVKKNNVIYFNSETSFDLTNRQRHQVKKIKPLSSSQRKHFLKSLRMVSTYNTLILPTKVNITVITNSFDVVHSWFVPGLGLKFDCVPGRSTHYTLRIDKPGIYYGHCAEVCGRFHHHMPIKICALPLNQFLYYYSTYYKI